MRNRERRPPPPDRDETWLYTRPEVTGQRTALTGEHDIKLPNGRIISVPDYTDEEIRQIATYHLHWLHGQLVKWERPLEN
ncbi:MAG: hypothetical protein J6386_02565 [Candidatus Synoicihabitans palmerolidicus]|nr:hypothetical protein [Candidatus Synoicihabitans palmerolidicus]